MAVSRARLEYASAIFLAEMRRQFAAQHPNETCPVKKLLDYSPAERSVLMTAIEKAIRNAGVEGDAGFNAWMLA